MVAFWIAATKSDQFWGLDKRKTPVDVFYEDFFVPRPVILYSKLTATSQLQPIGSAIFGQFCRKYGFEKEKPS